MGHLKKRLLLLCLSVITGSAILSASYIFFIAYLMLREDSPASEMRFLLLAGIPTAVAGVFFGWKILEKHVLNPVLDRCQFHENLLTNSTYELRSPLTSIKGNLEVALRRDRPVEEYREALKLVLRETDRSIDLLKNIQILSLSRFNPLELFSEQVDLKTVIHEQLESYELQMRSKGIVLEVACQDRDIICVCDRSLIGQTISNLLDKAVKYSPADGTVKVRAWKDEREVSLTVENSYGSMCSEELQHLSSHPYLGSEILEKNIDGLEVGLYIARYVMNAHHGDMKVSSADRLFSVTISMPLEYNPHSRADKRTKETTSGGLSIVHGCPLTPSKEDRLLSGHQYRQRR